MDFRTIDFLEWFKTKKKAKIDLCRSGAKTLFQNSLRLNFEELDVSGDNSYGFPPLLEAIASRHKVRKENVVVALGTTQALFLVCAALLGRGDEVLVEKPAYEPLTAVPRAMEAKVIRFERKFEKGYQVDLEGMISLLSPRTRLVILTNLHNPSGVFLTPPLIKNLAERAGSKGVRVLIDEIYLDFLKGAERETSFSLAENIIVISSLTKVYGLGGLRCGWILADTELVKKIRSIIEYVNGEGVFIGEQISARIFSQLYSLIEKNRELFERNRSMIKTFIQGEERLSWVEPAGGVICFPKVNAKLSGDRLASILLEKYETAVVPGSFFEEPQQFRLGFGVSSKILAVGLENIKKALEEL